jgi:glycosyltransferase involved in cell wall biosynthesis
MEWWFGFYLRVASAVGYAIVWTAHDLLPHEIVFADDRRARDFLLVKARVIIALSETTAADLRSLGARQVFVIPMGSYAAPYPSTMTREQARASFGFSDDDIVVTLIGRLERYKGADALLRAVASLAATSKIKVLLAGSCTDSDYRRELDSLVVGARGRVVADFHWIADENLARYLQASDIAVFPFREITNSGSINLAQSFGLPVVIPNLPNLRDIPEDSSIRFDVGVDSLLETLHRVERLSKKEYESMSKAAFAWSTREDWTGIARKTVEAYEVALHRSAPRPT